MASCRGTVQEICPACMQIGLNPPTRCLIKNETCLAPCQSPEVRLSRAEAFRDMDSGVVANGPARCCRYLADRYVGLAACQTWPRWPSRGARVAGVGDRASRTRAAGWSSATVSWQARLVSRCSAKTPGLVGIQDTQHPSGGIPPDIVWAMVTAGTEALHGHRVLLEVSPGFSTSEVLRRQRGIRLNVARIFSRRKKMTSRENLLTVPDNGVVHRGMAARTGRLPLAERAGQWDTAPPTPSLKTAWPKLVLKAQGASVPAVQYYYRQARQQSNHRG
jgi:hypothetical protein